MAGIATIGEFYGSMDSCFFQFSPFDFHLMKKLFFLPVMVVLLSVGLLLPLAGCRKDKPEV